MQGERASLGSLSEALNFEHGSSSNNNVIDQQNCWGDTRNLIDNAFQDYIITHEDPITAFPEPQEIHRCSLAEASSSRAEHEAAIIDDEIPEHEQFEELRNETVDLTPLFAQSSSSNRALHNVNLNAEFIEHPEPGTRVLSPDRAFEESQEGSSLEGRRVSCKRKALETSSSIGQSSSNGGWREYQRGESSSWTAAPPCYSPATGLTVSGGSLAHGPRGLVSGIVPNFPAPAAEESPSNIFGLRINSSNQRETINPEMLTMGIGVRQPVHLSLSNSLRHVPAVQHPLDLGHESGLGDAPLRIPDVSRNTIPPFRWGGGRVPGGSSSSVAPVDRNVSRNMLEIPQFVPGAELRTFSRSQTNRNLSGGNSNVTENVASASSRTSSSASVQAPPSNLAWPPYVSNSTRHRRRISELVRRLQSSRAAETLNPRAAADHPTLRPPPLAPNAPPDEVLLRSGGDHSQEHSRAYARMAASSFERQDEGATHSLRVLASTSRGRSRLVASEVRNILDLMRRGEHLQLEDMMLLDQSMFFGMADIQDRYRDMRLDVDNMSYEELLALEERIGDVCTGLSDETTSSRLKQHKYKRSNSSSSHEQEPCCVCQEEYSEGEDVGELECGHVFHSGCIKEWLKRKNICPICKTTGLNTSDKALE